MKIELIHYSMESGWSSEAFRLLDSPRTLLIVFGAQHLLDRPGIFTDLFEAFPNSHVLGCSTAGEILGIKVHDHSLVGAIIRFDHTDINTAESRIRDREDSFSAGALLARKLRGPGLKAVFLLSDGIHVNGTELIQGMNSELDESVTVTGGLAGDGDRFKQTWILDDGGLMSGMVCGVGFYGDRIHVRSGSRGGWDIFGPERKITRSQKNILYELDSKPALQLYKAYLGDRAAGLPATALLFPLSIRVEDSPENNLVRTVLSVDEEDQSMTFAGDIPQGSSAQLMMANFDRLVDGAITAANQIGPLEGIPGESILSIAVSCVGRRLILGERTEEELEAVLSVLPPGTQQIGFYAYGELSPRKEGKCVLHNQTMTLTIIYET